MPNILALGMIWLWPIIAIYLAKNRTPLQVAVVLTIVPYLLLPVGTKIYLPGLPSLDKDVIGGFAVFFILLKRSKDFRLLPQNKFAALMVIGLVLSPILTCLTNRDDLIYGTRVIDKLGLGYVLQQCFYNFTKIYVPLIIGINFINDDKGHAYLAKYLVIAGLIYTVPALWEVRMSPQLHTKIYGYFPHDFGQQIRAGGFRPVIFLGHGLLVAMFMSMVLTLATALWRDDSKLLGKRAGYIVLYLSFVLFLCKTWSAIIYAILAVPIIIFTSKTFVIKAATMMAVLFIAFPVIRASSNLVPTTEIIEFIKEYNYDRSASLRVRFENEDRLLAKASERPLLGWGANGRYRVYDEYTGEDISITDGEWMIVYGSTGWIGYISIFGLLTYPIWCLYRISRNKKLKQPSLVSSGLCIVLAINTLDLIPNASGSPLTYLLAGAILGLHQKIKSKQPQKKVTEEQLTDTH